MTLTIVVNAILALLVAIAVIAPLAVAISRSRSDRTRASAPRDRRLGRRRPATRAPRHPAARPARSATS